ncbi:MAG: hypothetical protein OEY18_09215 [Candidatus Aminicenantes bacterium]|nr:hypothetical protein [Candidatus Aminicenantes bacterium]
MFCFQEMFYFTGKSAAPKVYPGHQEFTDIGSEKQKNEEVTADAVTIKN